MLILKILSISDVISNSSSEAFIMRKDDADYYDMMSEGYSRSEPIDWDWVRDPYNFEAVCDLCNLDKELISSKDSFWWETPSDSDWHAFVDIYKDIINRDIILQDYYLIDIEDHFDNSENVLDSAKDRCVWYENRH